MTVTTLAQPFAGLTERVVKSLVDRRSTRGKRLITLENCNAASRIQRLYGLGLVDGHPPTLGQVVAGEIEMAPYVVRPNNGEGERYKGMLRLPLFRTLFMLFYAGRSHFGIYSGIESEPKGIARHIAATHHPGTFPVYDLQIALMHPEGLETVRDEVRSMESGTAPFYWRWGIQGMMGSRVARNYWEQLLDEYIPRAKNLDFQKNIHGAPEDVRPEFHTLASFLRYCSTLEPMRE
jgi:hypothetical protein